LEVIDGHTDGVIGACLEIGARLKAMDESLNLEATATNGSLQAKSLGPRQRLTRLVYRVAKSLATSLSTNLSTNLSANLLYLPPY
jgi:hypothetical protein